MGFKFRVVGAGGSWGVFGGSGVFSDIVVVYFEVSGLVVKNNRKSISDLVSLGWR